MFTNALLLGGILAKGRREFQKDLGRLAEYILRNTSEGLNYFVKGYLPTNLHLRQAPNCVEPLMPG
jgi:hypothetical protein